MEHFRPQLYKDGVGGELEGGGGRGGDWGGGGGYSVGGGGVVGQGINRP